MVHAVSLAGVAGRADCYLYMPTPCHVESSCASSPTASLGKSNTACVKDRSDPRLVKQLSIFASSAAVFSVVVGLSGLAGWKFHIVSLTRWGSVPATMAANTAGCFVLIGVSAWLLRKKDNQSFARARKLAARTAAAIAGLVGLLSLAEYLFRLDFGMDQFLLAAPAALQTAAVRQGLMSPITAGAFFVR